MLLHRISSVDFFIFSTCTTRLRGIPLVATRQRSASLSTLAAKQANSTRSTSTMVARSSSRLDTVSHLLPCYCHTLRAAAAEMRLVATDCLVAIGTCRSAAPPCCWIVLWRLAAVHCGSLLAGQAAFASDFGRLEPESNVAGSCPGVYEPNTSSRC